MAGSKRRRFLLICLWIAVLNGKVDSLKKKVCVVGAGPGGLSAIKQLSMWPDQFEPVAFEKNSDVGGQWIYTDRTDLDEHGLPVHSSIYKYLRTNGPKQLMTFPDYQEFYGESRSYVKHETVLEYVRNFTTHFNLRQFIKLNTNVEKVGFNNNHWIVKIRNLTSNTQTGVKCDAVMISVGNFHKPYYPKIDQIGRFRGRVLHSHEYRKPEEFANETVVIIGASFSGTDIGYEVSSYAKKVYLSFRNKRPPSVMPYNMVQVKSVVGANENELILIDGSHIAADSLILCTGYMYDYPFLSPNAGITVDGGKYVHPLYKHFINVNNPTMAILGIPHPGLPFQVLYVQSYFFTSYLRGQVTLPSNARMRQDAELKPGVEKSKAHYMEVEVLEYYYELANASGALMYPSYFPSLLRLWQQDIYYNPLHFKDNNFIIRDGEAMRLINHENDVLK